MLEVDKAVTTGNTSARPFPRNVAMGSLCE
jgi:hypothetical protein